MSTFTVDSSQFTQAITALHPFTTKDKDTENSPLEQIHANITGDGTMTLTGTANGDLAMAFIKLLDYQGELTDFSFHRDDVKMLTAQFRSKVPTDLSITVQHSETRVPPLTDKEKTKIDRRTLLNFKEEGALFGQRAAALAGTDGRELSMKSLWANIGAGLVSGVPLAQESFLDPADIGKLKKASALYGMPYCSLDYGRNILHARFGDVFYARIKIAATGDPRGTLDFDVLGRRLLDGSEYIQEHKLYVEDLIEGMVEQ